MAVPAAPAKVGARSASSAIWPPAACQRWVQPLGADEITGDAQSQPTPPISMAPLLAVVTLGAVMLVALYVASTAVVTEVSSGVVLLTPRYPVIPPPQFTAVLSVHV